MGFIRRCLQVVFVLASLVSLILTVILLFENYRGLVELGNLVLDAGDQKSNKDTCLKSQAKGCHDIACVFKNNEDKEDKPPGFEARPFVTLHPVAIVGALGLAAIDLIQLYLFFRSRDHISSSGKSVGQRKRLYLFLELAGTGTLALPLNAFQFDRGQSESGTDSLTCGTALDNLDPDFVSGAFVLGVILLFVFWYQRRANGCSGKLATLVLYALLILASLMGVLVLVSGMAQKNPLMFAEVGNITANIALFFLGASASREEATGAV